MAIISSPYNRPAPRRQPGTPGGVPLPGGYQGAENYNPTPGTVAGGVAGGYTPAGTSSETRYQGPSGLNPSAPADPLSVQIQNQLRRLFREPVAPGSSPLETRLQQAQTRVEKLNELQDARNESAVKNDLGILERKLREMGLYNGPFPGLDAVPTGPGGVGGLNPAEYYAIPGIAKDSINRAADYALADLPRLNREIASAGTNLLAQRTTDAGVREAELKQGLSTTGDLVGQLIDQKLRERIGDIGLQGQQVRSDLGASLAARGLNQSSFGAQRVAQSYMAEQGDVANARIAAEKSKSGIGKAIDDVTQQIATRRRELSNKQTLSQAQNASDVAFNIDANALNDRFKEEIAQLDLDARSGGFLGSFLGGIAGAVGGFFAGGPAGAAVGWNAGSKIGGAL